MPRITGLFHCLKELDGSLPFLYDFTIGYAGMDPDVVPETRYTLFNTFFDGEAPPEIRVHIRRYAIEGIPLENEEVFFNWLFQRFEEKDKLLESFFQHGVFTDEAGTPFPAITKTMISICRISAYLQTFFIIGLSMFIWFTLFELFWYRNDPNHEIFST